jgi:hypothetical protein
MTEPKIRAGLSLFDTEVSQSRGSLQKNQVFHKFFRLAVLARAAELQDCFIQRPASETLCRTPRLFLAPPQNTVQYRRVSLWGFTPPDHNAKEWISASPEML